MAKNTVGQFDGNIVVRGELFCTTLRTAQASIDDSMIASSAGIAASKIVRHQAAEVMIAAPGAAAVNGAAYLHIARAAGAWIALEAQVETIATGGDRTITIDVQKCNGGGSYASILTATLVLNNASAAKTAIPLSIASTAIADGDIFKVTWTVAGSSGAQGAGVHLTGTYQEAFN